MYCRLNQLLRMNEAAFTATAVSGQANVQFVSVEAIRAFVTVEAFFRRFSHTLSFLRFRCLVVAFVALA
jgi:hypothetical protein